MARSSGGLPRFFILKNMNRDIANQHFALAHHYLRLGDYKRGFAEYEWRHQCGFEHDYRTGNFKWWNGNCIRDKTLLIRASQGNGDIIQFIRFIPEVKKLGAKIILDLRSCPLLWRLLANSADLVICRVDHSPVPWDAEIDLYGLPKIFQTTPETIPRKIPYLTVPMRVGRKALAMIPCNRKKLRVGIVWAGSRHNTRDHIRSMTLNTLTDLLAVKNVNFFSLQKALTTSDLSTMLRGPIMDVSPYLEDFADTAAIIQEMDLVITVDTAVAHLTGALGKPVWTLLPFMPDWRWMLEREDSPWYPTMRLFRQPKPGDWASVIKRVAEELKALVVAKK